MSENFNNIINILIAWLVYFALHSSLASLTVKHRVAARWPDFSPHYRLAYNLAATLLLIPPLWLLHAHRGAPLWDWHGVWRWLMDGLALTAGVGFVWSLRYYDMKEFLGLRRPLPADRRPHLALSPFHRFVRHPWYFFGLVIIWTRAMDPAWLASCIAITLYFTVGSRLEEHKLVKELGEPYRRYRQRVPGLIPLPGRYLSCGEAESLITTTRESG